MTHRIVLIDIGNSLDLSGVLPSVAVHDSYSARVTARNGVAPYTYATDSLLPDGVELDPATGIFSSSDVGTAGTFVIAVTATDLAGTSVTRDFVLSVAADPVPLTLTGSYAAATVGTPYSSDLTIAGGGGTYSNPRVTVGALPTGLALSVVGDLLRLSGTPTTSAANNFTVAVDSVDGQTATSAQSVLVSTSTAELDLSMTGAEGGTSFLDVGRNAFAITPSGGITTRTVGVPGDGSATYFDGVNDRLSLPTGVGFGNFGTGDFHISVEAYCTDTSAERTIISCVDNWPTGVSFLLEIRSGGDLRFYAKSSTAMAIFGGAGSFAANVWQTITVDRVSGVTTLSVDGVAVGSHTGSVSISSANNTSIGVMMEGSQGLSSYWKGYLRDLKVTKAA